MSYDWYHALFSKAYDDCKKQCNDDTACTNFSQCVGNYAANHLYHRPYDAHAAAANYRLIEQNCCISPPPPPPTGGMNLMVEVPPYDPYMQSKTQSSYCLLQ